MNQNRGRGSRQDSRSLSKSASLTEDEDRRAYQARSCAKFPMSDARKILRVRQLNSPREPRRLSHAKFPGRNEEMASHVQLMLAGGGEFCDKAQDAVGILTGCSAPLTAPATYQDSVIATVTY
jgi:hypothetical protein